MSATPNNLPQDSAEHMLARGSRGFPAAQFLMQFRSAASHTVSNKSIVNVQCATSPQGLAQNGQECVIL